MARVLNGVVFSTVSMSSNETFYVATSPYMLHDFVNRVVTRAIFYLYLLGRVYIIFIIAGTYIFVSALATWER